MSTDTIWVAWWRYSLGVPEPGQYTLQLLSTTDYFRVDGSDYDGDGRPDFPGESFGLERTIYIFVG